MVSTSPSSMADGHGNAVAEKPSSKSMAAKSNCVKAPKKENKARREKQKREHLNELFLKLDCVLEPDRQNNGKACILVDTIRLLRDLIVQVESLRKDNTALLNESNYITVERNELKDDNIALEADVKRLQNELDERKRSDAMSSIVQTEQMTRIQVPQPSFGPFCFMPIDKDLLSRPETGLVLSPPEPPSNVMKPQARYPTAADAWHLKLLSGTQRAPHETLPNCSISL